MAQLLLGVGTWIGMGVGMRFAQIAFGFRISAVVLVVGFRPTLARDVGSTGLTQASAVRTL